MSIHIQQRDTASRVAYGESIGPAARRIVEAVAASTEQLQGVMSRNARYPADPRAAFAALVQMRRAQATVDAAISEYLAWLCVGGVTRTAMARGLGVRPATVHRTLAPVEHIASARGADLVRDADGTWSVHRTEDLLTDHEAAEATS